MPKKKSDCRFKSIRSWKNMLRQNQFQKCMLLFMLVVFLLYVPLPFRHFLFGNYTMRGGELGRMADTFGRTLIFRHTMRKRTKCLEELGIQLPPMKDIINKRGIPNLPQAALAELLVRSKIRTRQLQEAKDAASRWTIDCNSSIPNHIVQPDHGAFFRPVYAPGLEIIRWDHHSMRTLIHEKFPTLLQKFDRSVDKNEQTLIWSLCALYTYGGYVFGTNYRSVDTYLDGIVGAHGGCRPVGVFLFDDVEVAEHSSAEMVFMASSPRHAHLKRVIEKLENEAEDLNDSRLLAMLNGGPNSRPKVLPGGSSDDSWKILTCSCSKQKVSDDICCQTVKQGGTYKQLSLEDDNRAAASGILSPRVYIKVIHSGKRIDSVGVPASSSVEMTISESAGTSSPVKTPKATIQDRLNALKCNAGWMCNRCLKHALFGTHEACRFVCPSCYDKVICSEPDQIPKRHVTIDVSVREKRLLAPGEQRIPRIIHQTWFDEPTVDRYPQLARLQNSWKNTGWEYRFYTDTTMREYIAQNYPARFIDAFDAVIPGAFKADFFRYLVLLKDGGVYSDADILLDINLDSFVTPSMSFFVPRDIVGDYAGENFCLWNGLIGAAPGHPFMARAVEALLTNILNRVDYYDMERDMCQVVGSTGEVWKMRALTILLLTGPCLLGSAVNTALDRRSFLAKYEPGWLTPEYFNNKTEDINDIGDALLLIASRADMGALRFSDVNRNMIVASTGMTELSKDPILTVKQAGESREVKTSHVHYSSFERANDVFGAQSIYVDNLVSNELIKLKISRIKN